MGVSVNVAYATGGANVESSAIDVDGKLGATSGTGLEITSVENMNVKVSSSSASVSLIGNVAAIIGYAAAKGSSTVLLDIADGKTLTSASQVVLKNTSNSSAVAEINSISGSLGFAGSANVAYANNNHTVTTAITGLGSLNGVGKSIVLYQRKKRMNMIYIYAFYAKDL